MTKGCLACNFGFPKVEKIQVPVYQTVTDIRPTGVLVLNINEYNALVNKYNIFHDSNVKIVANLPSK